MAGDLPTYSFADVHAALIGPGAAVQLGSGAGVAEEGISYSFLEEADSMKIGADGRAMHGLNQSKAGRVIVRLLKTSSTNGILTALYNFQRQSSVNWGKNTITVGDTARGDFISCQGVAFTKLPDNAYAKDPNMVVWEFNATVIDVLLSVG